MSTPCLNQIFIFNLNTNQLLFKFPFEESNAQIDLIVEKYNKMHDRLNEFVNIKEKIILENEKEALYYSLTEDKFFICISASSDYEEENGFKIIDLIIEKNILYMIDDKFLLTHEGQLNVKYLFEEFQLKNKNDLDNKENIDNIIRRKSSHNSNSKSRIEKQVNISQISIKNIELNENVNIGQKEASDQVNKEEDPNDANEEKESDISHKDINNNISSKVLCRYWIIRILFILCIFTYIFIPIFYKQGPTKLGSILIQNIKEGNNPKGQVINK